MPELPEVETVARGLRAPLVGRTITSVWLGWPRTLHGWDADAFAAVVVGQRVRSVTRRAKFVVCTLDDMLLVVHLRMTGRLYVADAASADHADQWVHFALGLDDGRALRFSDSRKFGRVYLARELAEITGALGPEPLDDAFTAAAFAACVAGRRRAIKPLLLDQTVLAGVGNIYADEALHRARIHPETSADTLDADALARLHAAVQAALRDGIAREGASVSWYRKADGGQGDMQNHLFVYNRAGQPCLTCGTPVVKMRLAQRGTHFCPMCQPRL